MAKPYSAIIEGIACDTRPEPIWDSISIHGQWIPDGYEMGTTRMGCDLRTFSDW